MLSVGAGLLKFLDAELKAEDSALPQDRLEDWAHWVDGQLVKEAEATKDR
jgi:hypothetical protein